MFATFFLDPVPFTLGGRRMSKSTFRTLIIFGLFFSTAAFSTNSARATMLQLSATWSAILDGGDFSNQSFSGSATALFDSTLLTGSGVEVFDDKPLESLSLTPNPIGATTFDLTNTKARWFFLDGEFDFINIGGEISGVSGVAGSTDDFMLSISAPVPLSLVIDTFMATDTTTNAISVDSDPSGSASLGFVPEPGTITLLLCGLVGLICLRRR